MIQGREIRTANLLAREKRRVEDWNGALLMGVHREIFGVQFPDQAGRYRTTDSIFVRRAAPPHQTLDVLLQQLVLQLREHLESARSIGDPAAQLEACFRFAAIDHAEMLRIHPFVDGNGRWARIVTALFLVDCGLPIGTLVRRSNKKAYILAADRCIDNGESGDLANLFLRAYVDILRSRRIDLL